MPPAHDYEDLIRQLPLPLARLCRTAVNEEPSLEQSLAAYLLWEAGLKLLAATALVACASQKSPVVPEEAGLTTLPRPMLGHWRNYVRSLLPALVSAGVAEFAPACEAFQGSRADMPSAARLDLVLSRLEEGETDLTRILTPMPGRKVKLDKLFDRLVTHRNRFAHGAFGQKGTLFYENISPILLAGVVEVVNRTCVLPGTRMVHVARVERAKPDGWLVHRFDLTGEAPKRLAPLVLPLEATPHLPHCDRIYLESHPGATGADAGHFRPLHPLAVYELKSKEVFFFNGGDPQPDYLCYTDDRSVRRADLCADYQSFLVGLSGQTVPAPTPAKSALGAIQFALMEAASAPPALSLETIKTAYHAAKPHSWEDVIGGPIPADALTAYCRDLARCPLQNGTAPLVNFARTLAPLCPPEFAETLSNAIQLAAEFFGESLTPPAPHPPALPATVATAELYYLLIAIRAAQFEQPGTYEVKSWLTSGRETVCLEAGEERHTRAQLPGVVERLRTLAEARAVKCEKLWVEFLLPRELIPEAVDQWGVTIDDGLGTNAVGAEYPVLVRSADRYYCAEKFRAKRLQSLLDRGRRLAECSSTQVIRDLPPPERTPNFAIYPHDPQSKGRWLYNQLKDDQAVLCAVLETPPAPEAAVEWDVLNTLLVVGMPVVAWSRGQPAVAEEIVRQLAGSPLGELPDRIRRLRIQAVDADPAHAGRHVALLWDDPERQPPEFSPQNQLRPT